MSEMTCTLFCVILVSVPSAVLKLNTGPPQPPPRSQQAKKNPGLKIGLDRVSTCLADRAMVTELIITGSTGIARTSRSSG